MFDISWGEMALLSNSSVGLLLVIGRTDDLPPACCALGQRVGRIVGLIHQGARLRADRYASDHQLKQLQNEFRSGLRELDAVKAELAGSMMPRATVTATGGIGGNSNCYLGAMVSGVDRQHTRTTTTTTTSMGMGSARGAGAAAALQFHHCCSHHNNQHGASAKKSPSISTITTKPNSARTQPRRLLIIECIMVACGKVEKPYQARKVVETGQLREPADTDDDDGILQDIIVG